MKRSDRRSPRVVPDKFNPGTILSRFSQVAPSSYDAKAHTVQAVLSAGTQRPCMGILEELCISPEAIDLGRVALGQVPLLDTHNQYELDGILGRLLTASVVNGQLVGTLKFAETPQGQAAEAMVARGEVCGISVGYRVNIWTISGLDQDIEIWQATEWELLEVSLCAVPADSIAVTRSAAPPAPKVKASHDAARARMRMLQSEI